MFISHFISTLASRTTFSLGRRPYLKIIRATPLHYLLPTFFNNRPTNAPNFHHRHSLWSLAIRKGIRLKFNASNDLRSPFSETILIEISKWQL